MKRTIILISMLTVLLLLLSVNGFAAAEPTVDGIYGAVGSENVSVTPEGSKSEALIDGGVVNDFYAGAEKVDVTVSNATDGAFYLLLVMSKETTAPTADDIVYIDQVMASGGKAEFTAFPKTLSDGTYYVYIASNVGKDGLTKVGSFKHYASYILGDVDDSKSLSAKDALWVLQATVGKRTLNAKAILAADVDHSNALSAKDSLWILQATVGKRTLE